MGLEEYLTENKKLVNLKKLEADYIPEEDYINAHSKLPIVCHDAFLKYKGGILLLRRNSPPDKGEFSAVGGRVERGIPTRQSLIKKVYDETKLKAKNLKLIGVTRNFFDTDPFGHGKGTDTFSLVYSGNGYGEVRLNDEHSEFIRLNRNGYDSLINTLNPFIKHYAWEVLNDRQT